MKPIAILTLAIFFFSYNYLNANEIQTFNKALKKELGIIEEQPFEQNNTETIKQPEPNPIRERYNPPEEEGSLIMLLIRILFIFGGLTIAMLFILKIMAKARSSRFPIQGRMSILSSLPVGTNKQVQMVEVANRIFILGVGESTVNFLGEITDEEEKARIFREKQEYIPSQESFLTTLLDSFKNWKLNVSETKNQFNQGFFGSIQGLEELEKRQEEAIKKLQSYRKDLGMDYGRGG